MLLKKALFVVLLTGMIAAFGCGGGPTTPGADKDIESFFAGVNPVLTGIVGDYTFTGNDGTLESGKLVSDGNGTISLVPDRGSSIYSNSWFTIGVDYLNPRYYTGAGLPVYYLGDTFTYNVNVDYKRGLPLDMYPILYARLTTEQRYWPTMGLLPGDAVQVWDPFQIAPFQSLQVEDTFKIVSGTIPGNDATMCKVDVQFFFGVFQFNVAYGVAGIWDP